MTEVVVIVAVVVLAAAAGAVTHAVVMRRGEHGGDQVRAEGLEIADLCRPLLTLVAFLLGFVLVQTFSSFQDAADSADVEAAAVLAEGRAARSLEPASGAPVVDGLRCYARAVAGPGWDSLAGSRRTSSVSEDASARVEEALVAAERVVADQDALDVVRSADDARLEARRRRLLDAQPSVPGPMMVLLVASVAIVIGGSAALTSRRVRMAFSLSVLFATVTVFAGTLVVIVDLDQPFAGWARIHPDRLLEVEQRLGSLEIAPPASCDGDGTPTGS